MDIEILFQAGIFIFAFFLCIFFFGTEKTDENKHFHGILRFAGPLALLLAPSFGESLSRLLPKQSERYKTYITRMDARISPAELYSVQCVFGLCGVIAGIGYSMLLEASTGEVVFVTLTAVVIAVFYPAIYIKKEADKRSEDILAKLSFSIDLICSSMGVGLDFCSAVRHLVNLDSPNPLRYEFQLFLRQIELGKTRLEALYMMRDRIHLPEFTRFTAAIATSLDTGASILDIMKLQSEAIRNARFMHAEREVSKAPIKMIIPMALFIFPAMFIVIIVPIILRVKDSEIFSNLFK